MGKGDFRIGIAIQSMHVCSAKTGLTVVTTLTFHIEVGLDGRYDFLARFVSAWGQQLRRIISLGLLESWCMLWLPFLGNLISSVGIVGRLIGKELRELVGVLRYTED
jgi:hypothetical protein